MHPSMALHGHRRFKEIKQYSSQKLSLGEEILISSLMASAQQLVGLAMLAVVLPTVAMATQHIVGDSTGWTLNQKYDEWAKDKMFYVGDTLVFNYDASKHNVFQVNGTDFKNCTQPPPPNGPLTSGHDWVSLNSSGKYWFICGIGDHCANKGMKLVITVEDLLSPTPSPMSGAPTPSTDSATRGFSESGFLVSMAAVAAAALLVA